MLVVQPQQTLGDFVTMILPNNSPVGKTMHKCVVCSLFDQNLPFQMEEMEHRRISHDTCMSYENTREIHTVY